MVDRQMKEAQYDYQTVNLTNFIKNFIINLSTLLY